MKALRKLEPGSPIDDFVIDEFLGAGGFGAIYSAHGTGDRRVAIKVAHTPARWLSAQQLIWQQNEIEALLRLNHPGLVKVHGYDFLPDGRLYLVMDLVVGQRLDAYLAQQGLLETIQVLPIIRRIAEALAHCHEFSVLHLDLKPRNIILTDPYAPHLKLLDFGISCVTGVWRPADPGFPAGTIPYMAPECFAGSEEVSAPSARVDLYALGVIFYELLSGRRPFDEGDAATLIRMKLSGEAVPIRDRCPRVPVPLGAIVDSLLARDPAQRHGSASLLCHQLRDLYYATLHGRTEEEAGPDTPDLKRMLQLDQVPFIGRRDEMQALLSNITATETGKGRALLLLGQPGLGKSTLVAEVLRRKQVAGTALISYGRCRELGELLPYAPLREAIGQMFRSLLHLPEARGDRLRRQAAAALGPEITLLASLVPELHQLLPSSCFDQQEPEDLSQFRFIGAERVGRAVTRVLEVLAAEIPLVLVLEDLHWADEGTLGVLAGLVRGPLPDRMFLLCSSRPTARLPAGPLLQELHLGPLPSGDNDRLLRALSGGADSEALLALKDAVPLLATGNPLFNTQVMRNLEIEGFVTHSPDGKLVLSSRLLQGYDPPDSVHAVLRRTAEHLRPETLDLLKMGALVGRQFPISDLIELHRYGEAEIDTALEEAQRHGLCTVQGGRCSFAHDTIREYLAGSVATPDLPAIHDRIAEVLTRRGTEPATLGHHLEHAGRTQAAAEAFVTAGLESDRLHEPVGASKHLQRAFRLLARLPAVPERDDLLVRATSELARIACLLGSTGEILRHLDECMSLLGEKRPAQLVALKSSYARVYYVQGDFPKAMECSTYSLSTLKDEPALRAYQYIPANILGRAICASGKFGPAVDMLTRGCELAREAGEYVELSHSEGLLGVALGFTGEFDRAAEHVQSSLMLAQRLLDPIRMMGACFYFAALAEARGDYHLGVRHSTQLLAIAEDHGISGLYLYLGTMFAGRHQFHLGSIDRARVLLANSVNLAKLMRISIGVGWGCAFLGDAYFVAGRLAEAEDWYRQGLAAGNAANDEYAAPMNLIGLGHLAALRGQGAATVRALADEVVTRFRAVSNRSALLIALQRYVDAMERMAEPTTLLVEERAALLTRLSPMNGEFWPSNVAPDQILTAHQGGSEEPTLAAAGATGEAPPRTESFRGPAYESTLLESLSTIEDYVPQF